MNNLLKAEDLLINALDSTTQSIECIEYLATLLNHIYLLSKGKPELKDIFKTAKLGMYLEHDLTNLLDCHRDDLEKAIKDNLTILANKA